MKAIPHAPADPCETCTYAAKVRHELGETDSSWRWMEEFSPSARDRKLMHLYDSQGKEPFCAKFKPELRWARASAQIEIKRQEIEEPTTTLVYLAHPVSGDFENNIARAHLWLEWANSQDAREFLEIHDSVSLVVVAPWLTSPKNVDHLADIRAKHMRWCCAAVRRCDEIWLVGGRISKGMREEMECARSVRDLTNLGLEPPVRRVVEVHTGPNGTAQSSQTY